MILLARLWTRTVLVLVTLATLATIAAPTPVPSPDPGRAAVLACIRAAESDTAGGYRAVSATGKFRGAYQADRDFFLTYGGDPALAGTPDDRRTWRWEEAAPAHQDDVAWAGYLARGTRPWPPARHCG